MTTYYHPESKRHIGKGAPFTLNDIQYPQNWLELASSDDKAALGLVPVVTVETVPADYRFHNRTEQLVGSERIVTWTPFPQEQVAQMKRADIQAKIDALDGGNPMARPTREFMLLDMEEKAVAAGYTIEQLRESHFAYRKVKEFDERLTALRSELAAL